MNGQWIGSRAIRTNWATRKPPAPNQKDGNERTIKPLTVKKSYCYRSKNCYKSTRRFLLSMRDRGDANRCGKMSHFGGSRWLNIAPFYIQCFFCKFPDPLPSASFVPCPRFLDAFPNFSPSLSRKLRLPC